MKDLCRRCDRYLICLEKERMSKDRLSWIIKAVEYRLLTKAELKHLYKFAADFIEEKTTKTSEDVMESLFAEVQWREDKVLSFS
jgi:hypothetical protein